ncbi:MAG TPA: hypothetical protein VFJ16_20320 [Longimicrobium sp.]|nr:hypothetical protein [Longimicrobium sp.]
MTGNGHPRERRTIIGIIGGHARNTSPEAARFAEAVGTEIGRRGMAIVCGDSDGVAAAACRGCQAAGGMTLSVLKGNDARVSHAHVDFPIVTSMDVASNNVIVWTAAGLIAFDGRYGTLNEIALALDFGKPLVTTGRPGLLRVEEVSSPWFAHFDGYDCGRAPEIVDHLLNLISTRGME